MSEGKINFLIPPTPALHFRFPSGRSDKQNLFSQSHCQFKSLVLAFKNQSHLKADIFLKMILKSCWGPCQRRNWCKKTKRTATLHTQDHSAESVQFLLEVCYPFSFASWQCGDWSQCPHQGPASEPAAPHWRRQWVGKGARSLVSMAIELLLPCLVAPGENKDTQEKTVAMMGGKVAKGSLPLQPRQLPHTCWQ